MTVSELLLAAIIVSLVILLRQSWRRTGTSESAAQEELNVLRDLQIGMTRLEERVEALETLLLDRNGKGGKQ